MGACMSMPLVGEVILTDDYQTGTTVLDSTSSRTICEDLEVCCGNAAKGLKRKVSLLGWRHSLVNWFDDCWDRRGLSHGGMKNCLQEVAGGVETWGFRLS